MKKKIAVLISILFALSLTFMASAAMAQSFNPPKSTPSTTAKPGKAKGKAAERLAFITEIQPLLDEIVTNRQQIKTLQNNLVTAKQAALKHIDVLKTDLSKVTAEQLAKISDLIAQVKAVRIDFNASNTDMGKEIHKLRGNRNSRKYDALKTAYENIIQVQEERIDSFKKLISLYNQISLI